MRFRSLPVFLLTLVGTLVLSGPARASSPPNTLAEYSLSSWTEQDGLVSDVIRSIAEDSRGYLWVATDKAFLRFDGTRFVPWNEAGMPPLPSAPVRTVYVSRDGTLWIGLDDPGGGVTRVANGEARSYGGDEGIGPGSITLLLEDGERTMWAGNNGGLYRFTVKGQIWQPAPGIPPGAVLGASADARGNMWVSTSAGIFKRQAGQTDFKSVETGGIASKSNREHPRFEPGGAAINLRGPNLGGIAEDSKGRIWVTDLMTGFRALGGRQDRVPETRGRGIRLLYDTRGSLWIATQGQGLWRVRDTSDADIASVERLTTLNGFLSDGVTTLFEDRRHDIWVGTRDGLHRLTPHKVTGITDLGVVEELLTTPDGAVWVGTVDDLTRFPDPGSPSQRERTLLGGAYLRTMQTDGDGNLWMATRRDLLRLTHGRFEPLPVPAESRPTRINSIISDASHGFWVDDAEQGLLHWDGRSLQPFSLPKEFREISIIRLYCDRTGRVWLAFSDGMVGIIERGQFRSYGRQDGLDAGVYQTIVQAMDGTVWLGGSLGLTRFAGGQFSSLHKSAVTAIRSIVEDTTHALWLGTDLGILRVELAELEKAGANPLYQLRYTLFDKSDGLAGRPRVYGNAVRANDGRLWFVTSRGVTIVNPAGLTASGETTPVHVEGVVGNDARFYAESGATLPAGTTSLRIEYSVVNLESSLKAHFRYRLDGFDSNWVDAGIRRQAFYTNLPPGHYQFHVSTDGHDGGWSEPGATWAFSIEPSFYQTRWFFAVCAMTPILLIWTTWRLHVRRVRKEFTLLLAERARLSRDLHDTLLQDLLGVALECDAIANDLASLTPPDRERFVRMRKEVEAYIREARQSIVDLRSSKPEPRDLIASLREAGERAAAGSQVAFNFNVNGTPHRCASVVEEQLLRIGHEAVLNAIRHARARSVQMELSYNHRAVALRVRDDGCGFECEASEVVSSNHYGLTSMKERAESVGGDLLIGSRTGQGTSIEALLPSWPHQ